MKSDFIPRSDKLHAPLPFESTSRASCADLLSNGSPPAGRLAALHIDGAPVRTTRMRDWGPSPNHALRAPACRGAGKARSPAGQAR